MGKTLDQLLREESEAMENLAQAVIKSSEVKGSVTLAFIKFSTARNRVTRKLTELKQSDPSIFQR